MKVIAFPSPSGSRVWRLDDPFKALRDIGISAHVTNESITDEIAQNNDIFVLQNTVDKEGIALLRAYQQERGKKIVADFDDFFDANEDNPNLLEHQVSQAPEVLRIVAQIADLVTCTTDNLAKELRKYNKNVVVLPNSMDMKRWDLPKLKNETDYINIGWCGGTSHYNDLKMIVKPLKRILSEFPNVKLYLVGELRAKEWFKDYKNVECMLSVPFDAYPTRLHGLRLDIGLAPLQNNAFNRCKSNIKFLEYAIAKVPGVYSPTVYSLWRTTDFDGKFGDIAENEEQWYWNIRNLIVSKNHREDVIGGAYQYVRRYYDLNKNIKLWKNAYLDLILKQG